MRNVCMYVDNSRLKLLLITLLINTEKTSEARLNHRMAGGLVYPRHIKF